MVACNGLIFTVRYLYFYLSLGFQLLFTPYSQYLSATHAFFFFHNQCLNYLRNLLTSEWITSWMVINNLYLFIYALFLQQLFSYGLDIFWFYVSWKDKLNIKLNSWKQFVVNIKIHLHLQIMFITANIEFMIYDLFLMVSKLELWIML